MVWYNFQTTSCIIHDAWTQVCVFRHFTTAFNVICSDCLASRKLLSAWTYKLLRKTTKEKCEDKFCLMNISWHTKPHHNITNGAIVAVSIRRSDMAKTGRMHHTGYKTVVSKLSFCRRIIVRAQLFPPFLFSSHLSPPSLVSQGPSCFP